MITASSSSSDNDNNVSLGVDQEETLEARALTHDAASLSAVRQRRGDAPS